MSKLFAWLFLAAIVFGIAGLAVTTERSSAQEPPDGRRFDLNCTQTQDPDFNNGVLGIVECSLRVDLPDLNPAPPGWPDTIKVDFTATYNDRDKSGRPSRGDRLICLEWSIVGGPSGGFCR